MSEKGFGVTLRTVLHISTNIIIYNMDVSKKLMRLENNGNKIVLAEFNKNKR